MRWTGFSAHEVMSGWHRLESAPGVRLPLSLALDWGTRDLGGWLSRRSPGFLVSDARGEVEASGLVDRVACVGTLALRYVPDGLLRYDLAFEAGGRRLRLVGEKVEIRPWNLPVSHTTCFVRIVDAGGVLVSTGVLRFRLRTAPAFLASFRLLRAEVTASLAPEVHP